MSTEIKSERSSSCGSRHSMNDDSHDSNEDEKLDRKRSFHRTTAKDNSDDTFNHSIDGSQGKYALYLDFPTSWKYIQIKEYTEQEFEPGSKIEMLKDLQNNFIGEVKLIFSCLSECTRAKSAFEGKVVKGVRLSPRIIKEEPNIDVETGPPSKTKKENGFVAWRPDIDVFEEDPTGLYGFKPEFLQSIGINPPLQKWVHVDNIRCGKMELRGLMELAGEVVKCMVDSKSERFGKVMFSHPMEAVQAVMILNGQKYQNLALKVTMCEPASDILPRGLRGLGTGLGLNGKPLKDIVRHYERYAKGRSHAINKCFFRNPEELCSFSTEILQENSQTPSLSQKGNTMSFQSIPSQFVQGQNLSSFPVPAPLIPPQIIQGPNNMVRPGFPMVSNVRPVPGVPSMVPNNPTFVSGPRPVGLQNNSMFGSNIGQVGAMPCPVQQTQNSCVVEISNLPLNTSFATLSQKMAEVGQVLNLQLTSPGGAVVQFANRIQAEKCYRHFGARQCFFCGISVVQGPQRRTRRRAPESYLLTEDYILHHQCIVDYALHLFDEGREVTAEDRICRPCLQRADRFVVRQRIAQEQVEAEAAARWTDVNELYVPSINPSPDELPSDPLRDVPEEALNSSPIPQEQGIPQQPNVFPPQKQGMPQQPNVFPVQVCSIVWRR